MKMLAFVGPALRFLQKGLGFLADKSDANPNSSGLAALAAAGAGYLGIDPATRAALGKVLVMLGQTLGG